jgi:hypothetical protein
MLNSQIDLRWWLLDNLTKLEHPQEFYRLFATIFFVIFLFFSLMPFLLAKARENNLKRLLLSDAIFTLFLSLFILAARWPGLLAPVLNPDEALFTSGAMKLMKDPVFWRSLETGSSGPLNIYPLMLPALFGFRLEYAASRVIGLLLITLSVICLYYALRYLYGKAIARLSAMPVAACVALMIHPDYIHYTGEHVSIAILSIALLMLCKYYVNGSSSVKWPVFWFGFTAGLVPYAKLQAMPVAFILSCIFLHIIWIKQKAKERVSRSFFILLGGALVFSGFVLLYLVIFSLQEVFWRSYIQESLFYLNTNSSKSLFDKFLIYLPYARWIKDTSSFFMVAIIISIFGLPFLFLRRKQAPLNKRQEDTFVFVYYSLAFLIVSIYSTIAPGRGFGHHLLFLIIPSGFLIGVFLAEPYKILQAQESIRRNFKLSLAAAVIVAIITGSCTEFYSIIRKGNIFIAYRKYFAANYPDPIAKAILKHAPTGGSLLVWGWAPELYVDTGLIQATKSGNLFYEIEPNPRQPYFLKEFSGLFMNSKPDIFVDAVAPGMFFFHDRKTGGFDAFPEVAGIVNKYYTLADEVQGVRIFVRKPIKKDGANSG